ncbi:MAG: RDD family protein [Chitinophagaceae bacterium]|nr:RDD family protein [Chitinophagaceae bacterium]
MNETNEDLLTGIEMHLVKASTGKRFANFLIDTIVLYFIMGLIYTAIALVDPDMWTWMEADQVLARVINWLIDAVLFGSLMGLIETITKGRSPGKLITGTKAIQQDGNPITASEAFARGFIRMVPFEAFSALGSPCYPWHDKWTKTYVIDIKESALM